MNYVLRGVPRVHMRRRSHPTTCTPFKNYDTLASKSVNVLTEFQLGLFRSKENRLYVIRYPLSALKRKINVSLEEDSVKFKTVKTPSPFNRILRLSSKEVIH